ncbi:MAG TPA: serine hydrolase [Thermoanaerobaculia bacterium]|nr:serine hydrolase [Thermoanaerobaculia bacterium]
MRHRRLLLLALGVLFLGTPALPSAVAGSAEVARIDQLLRAAYPADEPGAVVLVVQDGQVLLRQGYGMANLELGVPLRPEMVFRVGSITKQFTAMAILKLAEQGKLALDDDITKFLPDYPTHGARITLDHLLTHTSGIPNYVFLPEWVRTLRDDRTPAQLVDVFKDQPAEFAPGAKWVYSNSGYALLGVVVEKVTGKSYCDELAETLFTPLGMSHTACDVTTAIVPNRVSGYEGTPGHYRNTGYISMTEPYAAGALVSTVDDLARWDRALASGTLLRRDLLDRMFTSSHLNDGRETRYGYGYAVWTYAGHRVLDHAGGVNGFVGEILRMPDDHLLVVLLSNSLEHTPRHDFLAFQIATLVLGLPPGAPRSVDPARLDRYAGAYRIDGQTAAIVTHEGDQLFFQRLPGPRSATVPLAGDEFLLGGNLDRLRFTADPSGKVTGLVFEHHYGGPETAVRANEPLPGAAARVP